MKVLIADKLAESAVQQLTQNGAIVRVEPDLTASDLPEAIQDAEVLVVRSTKVSAATIEAGRSLSLVIRAGAGVNTIDLATASRRGIYVCNCPGKNTAAVAELAIGLMIAADRRIADATASLRNGEWKKKEFGKADGLKGKTLGILGMGAIGSAVAKAAMALDMDIIAWSRSLTPQRADEMGVGFCESPEELFKQADVISLHLAVSDQTRQLVNQELLALAKPRAILINTSRGEIVDTPAVTAAMESRGLRFATDVFENEPEGGNAEFGQTELAGQICCTPHIGASTNQAADAIASEVVRIVSVYQEGGPPPGAVNLCQKTPATHSLVVRHFNRVGVLAKVMDGLRAENVNVEEMENVIFDGAEAACCTLQLDQPPSPKLLEELNQDDAVLAVTLNEANG